MHTARNTQRGLTCTRSRASSRTAALLSGLHTTAFSRVALASCHCCRWQCTAAVLYSTWGGHREGALRGRTQHILLNSAKKQGQALKHQKFSNRRGTLSSTAGKISQAERKNKSLGVLELLVKVRGDMGAAGEDSGSTLFKSDPSCIQKAWKLFLGFFLHATK